jgi:hypothetical protein
MNLRRIVGRLRQRVEGLRARLGWYPVRRNVNKADPRERPKRALLLYRITPFQLPPAHPEFLRHHNMQRARRIAAILDEFGYVVDAANGRLGRFHAPRGHYDLVINDRVENRAKFPPETTRVFLATLTAHPVHNARTRRRLAAARARRGCRLPEARVFGERMPFLASASAAIAIGNESTAGTWRAYYGGPIHRFDNYGIGDAPAAVKDFEAARRHFLFFGSRTQVHKGLDLLLEIFPRHPGLHLHVCSMFAHEPEFVACYRRELYDTPNVHPVGWTTVNSPRFHELARTAAFVIHPSCSEGQAGSVVQCMHAGLIPLVTRETGIDLDGVGVTFADDSREAIERAVLDVSSRPASWHAAESVRTRERAETRHSEAAFTARWRTILTEVLGHPPLASGGGAGGGRATPRGAPRSPQA